jgi:hypothetical protein
MEPSIGIEGMVDFEFIGDFVNACFAVGPVAIFVALT